MSYLRVEFHVFHPSPSPESGKAFLAAGFLLRRNRAIRRLPVRDFCSGAYKLGEAVPGAPEKLAAAIPDSTYRLKPSDYMSFAALAISAVTAIYNLVGWWQGPVISFVAPEKVSFHCYPAKPNAEDDLECHPKSNLAVRATNLTYVNNGRHEYGGALLDETATVRISSLGEVTLHWNEFSNLNTGGSSSTNA